MLIGGLSLSPGPQPFHSHVQSDCAHAYRCVIREGGSISHLLVRLAEFTPLGDTAGWLKLAAQVNGASSAGHRRDEPHHQPVIDMMILGPPNSPVSAYAIKAPMSIPITNVRNRRRRTREDAAEVDAPRPSKSVSTTFASSNDGRQPVPPSPCRAHEAALALTPTHVIPERST